MTTDKTVHELEHAAILKTIEALTENCDESRWMGDAFRECATTLLSARVEADSLRARLAALQPVRPEGGQPAPHEPGWWWVNHMYFGPMVVQVYHYEDDPSETLGFDLCDARVDCEFTEVSSTDIEQWGARVVEWVP